VLRHFSEKGVVLTMPEDMKFSQPEAQRGAA
jgi:hypothetical protein